MFSTFGAQASTILVFGDSISASYGLPSEDTGWVGLLSERVAERQLSYQVANGSVSGETTGGGLVRLHAALDRYHPKFVVLELGGNDALRGYSIAAMKENLLSMTRLSMEQGAQVIIAGMKVPPNYGPRYSREFDGVFVEVSRETDCRLIPFLLEGIATNPDLMQPDGIHPNAEAQPLILDVVWEVLAPMLETASLSVGSSTIPSAQSVSH